MQRALELFFAVNPLFQHLYPNGIDRESIAKLPGGGIGDPGQVPEDLPIKLVEDVKVPAHYTGQLFFAPSVLTTWLQAGHEHGEGDFPLAAEANRLWTEQFDLDHDTDALAAAISRLDGTRPMQDCVRIWQLVTFAVDTKVVEMPDGDDVFDRREEPQMPDIGDQLKGKKKKEKDKIRRRYEQEAK